MGAMDENPLFRTSYSGERGIESGTRLRHPSPDLSPLATLVSHGGRPGIVEMPTSSEPSRTLAEHSAFIHI